MHTWQTSSSECHKSHRSSFPPIEFLFFVEAKWQMKRKLDDTLKEEQAWPSFCLGRSLWSKSGSLWSSCKGKKHGVDISRTKGSWIGGQTRNPFHRTARLTVRSGTFLNWVLLVLRRSILSGCWSLSFPWSRDRFQWQVDSLFIQMFHGAEPSRSSRG